MQATGLLKTSARLGDAALALKTAVPLAASSQTALPRISALLAMMDTTWTLLQQSARLTHVPLEVVPLVALADHSGSAPPSISARLATLVTDWSATSARHGLVLLALTTSAQLALTKRFAQIKTTAQHAT
jgi:hypothetical protein